MKKALLLSLLLMAGYASAAEYPQELLMKWKSPEARAIITKVFKEEKMNNQQLLDLVHAEVGRKFNVLKVDKDDGVEYISRIDRTKSRLTPEEKQHIEPLMDDFIEQMHKKLPNVAAYDVLLFSIKY